MPSKIVLDAGKTFISEKFEKFSKMVFDMQYDDIWHAVWSSYNYHSNGLAEAWSKFMQKTMKKCYETNADKYMSLLQIRSTPISPGLPSPAMFLFNRLATSYCQDSTEHWSCVTMVGVTCCIKNRQPYFKQWNRYWNNYICFNCRINCSHTMQVLGTMDAWNDNRAKIRRPQWAILQDQNDKDRMHHN